MSEFINRIGLNLNIKDLDVLESQYDEEGRLSSLKVREVDSEDQVIINEGTSLDAITLNTIIREMIVEEFNLLFNNYVTLEKNVELSCDDANGVNDETELSCNDDLSIVIINNYEEILNVSAEIINSTTKTLMVNFNYNLQSVLDDVTEIPIQVKLVKQANPNFIVTRLIYNVTLVGTSQNPED